MSSKENAAEELKLQRAGLVFLIWIFALSIPSSMMARKAKNPREREKADPWNPLGYVLY